MAATMLFKSRLNGVDRSNYEYQFFRATLHYLINVDL